MTKRSFGWLRLATFLLLFGSLGLAGCAAPPALPDPALEQRKQDDAIAKIEANDQLTPAQKKEALQVIKAGQQGTAPGR